MTGLCDRIARYNAAPYQNLSVEDEFNLSADQLLMPLISNTGDILDRVPWPQDI
jgi:hypothetical protein